MGSIRSVEQLSLRVFDPEQGQAYDVEAYKLENDEIISYDHRSGSWQDNRGRVYRVSLEAGKIIGFTREAQDRQGQTQR